MSGPKPGERQLVADWSYGLVCLSYAISWLGAYTSTQIVIHAKYSRSRAAKWIWSFLASVAFGFTAIWSMHFVGMLACGLDVKIGFNVTLTILSAAVAIMFTFAAFSTAYTSEALENSVPMQKLTNWGRSLSHALWALLSTQRADADIESGRIMGDSQSVEERRPILASTSDNGDNDDDEEEREHPQNDREYQAHEFTRPHLQRSITFAGHEFVGSSSQADLVEPLPRNNTAESSYFSTSISATFRALRRSKSPPPPRHRDRDASSAVSTRTSEDSTPLATTDSSDDSTSITRRASVDSSGQLSSGTPTTLSSHSWSDPLHAGLSREARLRIKAQARDKPVPQFGWRYWFKQYYSSVSLFVVLRAAVWGLAIVFMHYCGMWAMEIPEGRIEWNLAVVVLSYIVAFCVCFVGCIAMVHMEVHFGRQVAFSTIAALGVCSMHYTGMRAATFYTMALPSEDAGYPAFLPFTIAAVAAFVCVISNAVLAHSAIISRNHMAEVILTKRRLWRIMAEKEAAEQANELKQQFISVASHEIRTPLHAVNGYCELLAMTQLNEEQSAYVLSIQQACHAINVIAGNVLDFSKLDRDNVELSARPILLDLRNMVIDQARIIETRALTQPHPAVDVIVSVDPDVPPKVYLDETYTYRILMNLLSNAQKFCEEGYVCVHVSMDNATQVAIKISDTGCGIPKSFRHALFQPFRQADSSLTRPKQGTGLGLSIVKHLVQRMAGTVDVESVEGEGSTFTVKLPITVPTSTPPKPIATLSLKKRLKIVYRHERTAKLLSELWTKQGFTVTLAAIETSLSDLVRGADAIWTDVTSVRRSTALKEILGAGSSTKLPPMFLVHSDIHELATLEPALSQASGVILVKRPIVTHELVDSFVNSTIHVDEDNSPRVRFALPSGKTPMEERKIDFPAPTPALPVFGPHEGEHEHYKVLLVEDNMVNQRLGQRLLERLGYDAVTANNGQEAVDMVKETTFHCCFMDCQMPVLDGFAATSKIRELEQAGTMHGRLPIIALTANVSSEAEAKCRAAGMDYFLPKPFKMTDLQAALGQVRDSPRHS